MAGILFCLLSATILVSINKSFRERSLSVYTQTKEWFEGSNNPKSGGSGRLSMWTISWQLIKDRPVAGYGSKANFWDPVYHMDPSLYLRKGVAYETEEPIRYCLCSTGEHNQYLCDYLLSGFLGCISRIALLVIPLLVFFRSRNFHSESYAAKCIGICFICSFIIFGITQGPFSYKFICSFYGFMIAALASQLCSLKNETDHIKALD